MVTLRPNLSYTTNLNLSLGISKALNVQMSPFIFQQHSFIHHCTQLSYHLMCEQWSVLNEAFFSQTQSQQTDDHITKSSVRVVLSCYQQSQRPDFGAAVGDLSAFAPLKQSFLPIQWGERCISWSPYSMGFCSCQIYLFRFGNQHRTLTPPAALCYKN